MPFAQRLQRLDGRHKLAILMGILAWGVSIYFSQQGFALDNERAQWLGWFLGFLMTTMELVFNSRTIRLSLTLIIIGIACYGYGVWTNVEGFWSFQHTGMAFIPLSQHSIMAWFVGIILEILPEPLFMWGIGAELEGDLLGNLAGLWGGHLDYATPYGANQQNNKQEQKPNQNQNQAHRQQEDQLRPAPKQFQPTGQSKKHNQGQARLHFLEAAREAKKNMSSDTQPKFKSPFYKDE